MNMYRIIACAALLAWSALAQAGTISRFSPQGEVVSVRQVRATFSEAAVRFGDPRAPAPFDVACSEAGSGRWADERNWVFDFSRDVPPGVRCSFTLKPDFRLLSGATVDGARTYRFQTGGPAVVRIHPASHQRLDEEQVFLLLQNGPASGDSLLANVWCEAAGVQERIPVRLVTGPVRDALIEQFESKAPPERLTALQCAQRLPNEAAVRLVWGKGVSTPGANGVASSAPQSFAYEVRRAFSAGFSCARENAQAACSPLSPLRLALSAPVARALAQKITLSAAGRKMAPVLEGEAGDEFVRQLSFKAPLPENSPLVLALPPDFRDDAGRPLANASLFPMQLQTAVYPPLAKFAAAPFGIIELDDAPAMPVTVRNIEADARVLLADGQAAPTLASLRVEGDAAIMAWLARLDRYHDFSIDIGGKMVEARSIGLLAGEAGVRQVALPAPDGGAREARPFEVIGIPLPAPGFYVMELASERLGAALLGKPAPMYVRTSALVTNLAVHLKVGRENGAVWVTTLDGAAPVAGADVRISDCFGKLLWRGATGADGVAMVPQQLDVDCGSQRYDERLVQGLFVSARATGRDGRADMAFALSSWNSGIEPFRFNLPTDTAQPATVRAHTVFDRTLFRAGQTVSMKHLIRTETGNGFALPPASQLPNRLRIRHQGSGQEFRFPLSWRGGASDSVFAIPAQARLGRYQVLLDSGPVDAGAPAEDGGEAGAPPGRAWHSGSFRVEEFRLPLLQGRIAAPGTAQIAPSEIPLALQLNYLNGGGASGLPVSLSALLRERALTFAGYEDFSFNGSAEGTSDDRRIVADKLPVKLDRNGAGSAVVRELPALTSASELLSEMHFADPNGEIQTISQSTPLWTAAVVAGIRNGNWLALQKSMTLTAVALDLDGKPRAGVPLEINGMLKQRSSHRKRMVGGFYAYENSSVSRDLGRLCSGRSDARGLLQCDVKFSESGEVVLTALATDGAGRRAGAAGTVWVGGSDDNWFGAGNQDRIDLLPERKQYQPGETAVFQVRMPFREATALVAVEREGVMETSVVRLSGSAPVIRVPVTAAHAPNVYVSVLALRPRLREVRWYSFFSWGWREPRNWLADFRADQSPGPTIDLARPAFRFGIAEIGVGAASHALAVKVSTPQPTYPVRGRALATVQVNLPDGRPAAGAEIALAAVDEALLELQPNDSWNLLPAMLRRRSYGVQTATAQLQVVGKRHYGRKAMPPGGGGGRAPTRELLDTLLLWQPAVMLDEHGRAQVEVPLNDALSGFRIVAVATSGAGLYGYGATTIRTTQDLQLISGLPPLVRQGDRYSAMATVRNGAGRPMDISVSALVDGKPLDAAPRHIALAVGEARELAWEVTAPASGERLGWELRAREAGGAGAEDALKFSQKLLPAVPVTVQQASLFQLDRERSIELAPPAGALPGRGGVAVALAPGLAGAADGLRRYFSEYPYSCLEQKASRAVGLDDHAGWQRLTADLPAYLDSDGLARYYPSAGGAARGSAVLTAYLLALAHEAGWSLPEESRERMLRGLQALVEGRIAGSDWAPRKDTDIRRLSALEALSRYGRLPPRGLDTIQITPGLWPTSALLDWVAILRRTPNLPSHARRLDEAGQELRSRLNFQGSRMGFSSEASDDWFWLMAGADANAARLVLLAIDDPGWRDDIGRLLTGALGRQQRGHWNTTTANAWGMLALRRFSAAFEAEAPGGATRIVLRQGGADSTASHRWDGARPGRIELPWNAGAAAGGSVALTQDGPGKPWVTLQSLAAVPLAAPWSSGYRIRRSIAMVEQKQPGMVSRGDILRITLEVDAQADMTQVVLSDPVPAGAAVLGSGLGRDTAIAAAAAARPQGAAWPEYEERSFDSVRAYYAYVPKGVFSYSYTVRLNNPGLFQLPPSRVEAMYAPDMQGLFPNAALEVR
jgi:uncharacterized protein YfaS (alpha-2-macroglobulin family)